MQACTHTLAYGRGVGSIARTPPSDVSGSCGALRKMPPATAPDAAYYFLTAAYVRDGVWCCEHLPVTFALLCVSPTTQPHARCPRCGTEKVAPLRFRPLPFHDMLRGICKSGLADGATLEVDEDMVLRLHKIPVLTACRADEVPFGRLSHWSRLIEHAQAPNIVFFCCAQARFWVVCAKVRNTQHALTRSALCWLRQKAGLGFACDSEGGVFLIQVSRESCDLQNDYRQVEGLAPLLAAASTLFPASLSIPDEN